MREDLYRIIEKSDGEDLWSSVYDYGMIGMILLSILPLAFKQDTVLLRALDRITVTVFIVDYLLRLFTADLKFGKKKWTSFARYPFSPMALVDLLAILPSLTVINGGFKLLRVVRMARAMRVFRVFKAVRYSRTFRIIGDVLQSSRASLISVGTLAFGYILISALIIFNVEPDSFATLFDAIYWATVSLTTVGYGDIYPVSTFGRIVAMVSSIFGIAIVALPAGIITAGYMNALRNERKAEGEDSE